MPENHLDDYDTKHLASLMEQQKLVQAKIQAFSEYLTPVINQGQCGKLHDRHDGEEQQGGDRPDDVVHRRGPYHTRGASSNGL